MKQPYLRKKRSSSLPEERSGQMEQLDGMDQKSIFSPWNAIHAAISNLLRQSLAALTAHPHEQGLHDFRKAAKRIRALVRMTRTGSSKNGSFVPLEALGLREKTLDELDKLLHSLSQFSTPIRDLHVQIQLLSRMRRKMKEPVEASLCRFLEERCRLQLHLASPVGPRVVEGVKDALDLLPESPGKPLHRSDLGHATKEAECKLRKAKQKAASHPHDSTRLHTWRKRAKTLWYMTDFLQAAGFPSPTREEDCPKELKKLTDLLGKDRDLALLAQSLDQIRAKGKKRLRARIEKKRDRLQKKIFGKRVP